MKSSTSELGLRLKKIAREDRKEHRREKTKQNKARKRDILFFEIIV